MVEERPFDMEPARDAHVLARKVRKRDRADWVHALGR